MSKSSKIIVYIVLSLTLLLWLYKLFISNNSNLSNLDGKNKKTCLNFASLNEKIYIYSNVWGVAGNHEEIVLSNHEIKKNPKKTKDYIFYSPVIYYKQQGVDSLFIYVNNSSISTPDRFDSRIKIVLIGIKTADEAMEFEKNYLDYGLKKISVYD